MLHFSNAYRQDRSGNSVADILSYLSCGGLRVEGPPAEGSWHLESDSEDDPLRSDYVPVHLPGHFGYTVHLDQLLGYITA